MALRDLGQPDQLRQFFVGILPPDRKMSAWFWVLIIAIGMIVAASIGFAVTSSGAWRWILMIIGILLLLISIAGLIINGASQRGAEFLSTPQGQAVLRAALI